MVREREREGEGEGEGRGVSERKFAPESVCACVCAARCGHPVISAGESGVDAHGSLHAFILSNARVSTCFCPHGESHKRSAAKLHDGTDYNDNGKG